MMKTWIILSVFMLVNIRTKGQPNCYVFKNNLPCHEACLLATSATNGQGSRESQMQFDKAIELCPSLDYAYFEKSVPYIKRGDLKTWRALIDKAIELNPSVHLRYRAWCRFQFARDYKGAIEDFKKMRSLVGEEIGYSQNGDYNLNIVEALCYSKLGQVPLAIQLIEKQFAKKNYSPGSYDYLHLGILKINNHQYEEGIQWLDKEISLNDYLADTYYYRGVAYWKLGQKEKARKSMEKAREFYIKGYKRSDPYTHPLDKVYLSEIEAALSGG